LSGKSGASRETNAVGSGNFYPITGAGGSGGGGGLRTQYRYICSTHTHTHGGAPSTAARRRRRPAWPESARPVSLSSHSPRSPYIYPLYLIHIYPSIYTYIIVYTHSVSRGPADRPSPPPTKRQAPLSALRTCISVYIHPLSLSLSIYLSHVDPQTGLTSTHKAPAAPLPPALRTHISPYIYIYI
jgi:hypothetical protein